jgi:hypothetical protein
MHETTYAQSLSTLESKPFHFIGQTRVHYRQQTDSQNIVVDHTLPDLLRCYRAARAKRARVKCQQHQWSMKSMESGINWDLKWKEKVKLMSLG